MTEFISKYKKINLIILVFAFAIAIRILFIWYNFHGIEYEDAYIFADTARSLMFDYDWSTDVFQTKSCMDGSLKECYTTKTYGGHYMVFPFSIFLLNKLIGYSVLNAFIVNYIASIIILFIFYRTLKTLNKNNIEIIIAMALFAATPFINVFNTSGLSETFSSLLVITFIYFFFCSFKISNKHSSKYHIMAILFLVLAFLTKRENLILLALPVLKIIKDYYYNDIDFKKLIKLSLITLIPLAFAIIYNLVAKVDEMEMAESVELGVSTFSFNIFRELFPVYLKSYLDLNYYGISGVIVLLICLFTVFKRNNDELKLTSVLAILYLLMYSSHYRSYYQIHYDDVELFDTLRYSSNFYPIACLALSNLYSLLIDYSHKINRVIKVLAFSLLFCFILYSNIKLRVELSEIEFDKRILPVTKTLEITKDNDIVLTDLTSVFYLYAKENRIFIDSHNVDINRLATIINSSNYTIYYLNRISNEKNITRYANLQNIYNNFSAKPFININKDYELLILSRKANQVN